MAPPHSHHQIHPKYSHLPTSNLYPDCQDHHPLLLFNHATLDQFSIFPGIFPLIFEPIHGNVILKGLIHCLGNDHLHTIIRNLYRWVFV
jgi:hypothetical protein